MSSHELGSNNVQVILVLVLLRKIKLFRSRWLFVRKIDGARIMDCTFWEDCIRIVKPPTICCCPRSWSISLGVLTHKPNALVYFEDQGYEILNWFFSV